MLPRGISGIVCVHKEHSIFICASVHAIEGFTKRCTKSDFYMRQLYHSVSSFFWPLNSVSIVAIQAWKKDVLKYIVHIIFITQSLNFYQFIHKAQSVCQHTKWYYHGSVKNSQKPSSFSGILNSDNNEITVTFCP